MSLIKEFDDDQLFALMKFRRLIDDVRHPNHDNKILARWLKARDWKLEDAEKMYRDSMKWREQWEVDTKLAKNWEPSEFLQKYFISGLSGYDKDGAPVQIVPFLELDLFGMLNVTTKTEIYKYTLSILEGTLERARKTGANQVCAIIDLEGFNLRHYTHKPVAELVISLIQMYEANYPEVLKKCYIINAPSVFALAFAVVKKFLNEYTISKIEIIKNENKWKEALLENIDPDQLPKFYGGTQVDPDGNPRCVSRIKIGGKVPKSMYLSKEEMNTANEFVTAVVKKGNKLKMDFICADKGSFLNWEFQVDSGDIKFSVLCENENGDSKEVVESKRVSTHYTNEVGFIECDGPGTYSVIFDNTYSYFRNKKINYDIRLVSPLSTLDLAATPDLTN